MQFLITKVEQLVDAETALVKPRLILAQRIARDSRHLDDGLHALLAGQKAENLSYCTHTDRCIGHGSKRMMKHPPRYHVADRVRAP